MLDIRRKRFVLLCKHNCSGRNIYGLTQPTHTNYSCKTMVRLVSTVLADYIFKSLPNVPIPAKWMHCHDSATLGFISSVNYRTIVLRPSVYHIGPKDFRMEFVIEFKSSSLV
jgi:hypothetical protein